MWRERINHIRKRLRKNTRRCISKQMCRESAVENLKKKSPYQYQYSNGSRKSCKKAFEGHFSGTRYRKFQFSAKINRNKEIVKICENLFNMTVFRG